MTDISFIIHILSSVLALSAAYGLVMTVLSKELNRRWLTGEAIITIVAAAIATAFSFMITAVATSVILYVSLALLYGALLLALGVLLTLRFAPEAKRHSIAKNLSILVFSALLLHLLLELASIAWF